MTISSSDASKNASSSAPGGGPTDAQDLTVFVQSLLEQMQSRFAQMSDAIIGRNILSTLSFLFAYHVFLNFLVCDVLLEQTPLDEMGSRIDELEKSIADLMEQVPKATNEDGSDKNQEPTAGASAAKDKTESV
ncbi:hypothetical protein P3T76_005778 [Phytophthora citrophthora]|uniref:Heat shock factor-binding protein 1 n=1 Tax=Phytophthora citrophthora TaxID=4793 RepID=A0AAD9GS29_9STRA|nr:hypothetical protein P3T76_005778 [Phytophthora citrophthora]